MKKVYLIRHGKSSWKNLIIGDFDRSLNKRGKRDVPFMAEVIKNLGIKPDILISSPAKRARKTAEVFADKLELKDIFYDETLYEAEVSDVLDIIQNTIKKYDTVFIFGHNPTLTDTANYITGESIENIPTTGIVGIDLDENKLLCFEYPKKYANFN